MTKELKTTVKVDRLFLATDNPRHDEVDDEGEAIGLLCRSENIEELARDIVKYGSNPAERLIVFPVDPAVDVAQLSDKTTFIVAEGNRRVCALKLLHDPDLAPPRVRDTFRKLADGWEPIVEIDVVVIVDQERRKHWMRRIHDGVQQGKGRKPWDAEQKTRFSGTKRNIIAQELFDYAVARGMMRAEDRKGSFSHMARLVGNALVAEAIGIDFAKGLEELHCNRPKDVFECVLRAVLLEAREKALGSQATKLQIDAFARRLTSLEGFTTDRIEPEPIVAAQQAGASSGKGESSQPPQAENAGLGDASKPSKPSVPRYIVEDAEIRGELDRIASEKLLSLYHSICSLNVERHTPLIAIGVWAFLECLTASMGRQDSVPFSNYFSSSKLTSLGLGKGKELSAYGVCLQRASVYGNVTKHHSLSANFDYRQIINDMNVLRPLIVASLKEIV